MNRRKFLKAASGTAVISALPFKSIRAFSGNPNFENRSRIIPRGLKKGDKVGLISPGSFISEKELEESILNLKEMGFEAYYTDRVTFRNGYLAGSDEERAADLMEMFANKNVAGIICTRGGYGCARLLPKLNFEIIANNPKPLIGYSDVTALLYGIYSRSGLVCFHGPVGISTFNDFSLRHFKSVLMEGNKEYQMQIPLSDNHTPDSEENVIQIRGGKCEGELIGGNLSIVCSLLGTPYDVSTEGKILFLEEIGEEPYRIDRMLTQLLQAGKFDNIAGIALGIFKNCDIKKGNGEFSNSFRLIEVLNDRLYDLGVPVIYGLPFGHVKNKFTLPLGVKTILDVDNRTLTLVEKSVEF